jgi:CheY-like chemotaxis protein
LIPSRLQLRANAIAIQKDPPLVAAREKRTPRKAFNYKAIVGTKHERFLHDDQQQTYPEEKIVGVIDDDESIREIYERKMRQEGFQVVTAPDGEKGLAVIRETKPDIILLDIQMPIKDGFDVLKELEDDEAVANIPVVILSNVDDEQTFRKIGKFETRFYLVKSITTPQQVADIVREVLHCPKDAVMSVSDRPFME